MTAKHECQTCGQPIPMAGGIVADQNRGEIRHNGKACYLPPREFAIFLLLLERAGRVVTKEVLMDQLYQLIDTEPEIKIVDVFVCKMRKRLRFMGGFELKTWWGRGYSLEVK